MRWADAAGLTAILAADSELYAPWLKDVLPIAVTWHRHQER
jgi:hypothetical protein